MNAGDRIFVAGHRGLVGSALVRRLESEGFENLILRDRRALDLADDRAVRQFFDSERPDYVFLAAARVGGIVANRDFPAEFIRENLAISLNVIDGTHRAGVRKLLFLGSSCVYPKHAPQPIREEYLLSGALEPTNEPYAVAKIAGIKMCQAYARQYGANFISVMPTNVYGPGDNFDPPSSHVLPALIRKFREGKREGAEEVIVWGTGQPRREFIYVDDLADACVFAMKHYDDTENPLNIGTGADVSIRDLADLISEIVGFEGTVSYDPSKPDGTPRKLLDVSRLRTLGWQAKVSLSDGIRRTLEWYERSQPADPSPHRNRSSRSL